ncbi:C40 family peptidase [Cytobacillus sp. FJAT-54145]|uniref:C40 family peptidase n=1 Tax=Cytobacillus spartinae TaxID=3299023 RepID=A0ABW6K517_9BACI
MIIGNTSALIESNQHQKIVEAKADELINLGKELIRKATYSKEIYKPTYPYKFSCATFLMYIFEKCGVDLATYNENYMMLQGVYVPRSELQKGDLLFFLDKDNVGEPADHVGMYIGENKMIHMANPKYRIVISDLDSKSYYKENYVTARRILPTLIPQTPLTKNDKIIQTAFQLKYKAKIGLNNDEKTFTFNPAGFISYVFESNGVHLNTNNIWEQMNMGKTVKRSELKKGDLIFFSTSIHSSNPYLVGIYAGEHRMIIPTYQGVKTRVLFVDYYKHRFLIAKRILDDEGNIINPYSLKLDKVIQFSKYLMEKATFGYTYSRSTLTFTGAGFVHYVFKQNGIELKYRKSNLQVLVGEYVLKPNLQKGDLIIFSGDDSGLKEPHTGIYIGNNEFIHLSRTKGVTIESIDTDWAQENYMTSRRVLK